MLEIGLTVTLLKTSQNAALICSLHNGAPIGSQAIWQILERLRLHIKRMVECGSVTNKEEKEKVEYLLLY